MGSKPYIDSLEFLAETMPMMHSPWFLTSHSIKWKLGQSNYKNWVTDFTVFPICFQLYCLQFNLAATLLLFHLSNAFSLFFRETALLLYSFSQLTQYLIKWYNYDSRSKWHNHIWEQTIMHLRQYTMYMMGAEIYGH